TAATCRSASASWRRGSRISRRSCRSSRAPRPRGHRMIQGGHYDRPFRILRFVNRTIEAALRFVNLTSAGLLAGSLGFGDAALVPGWKEELPAHDSRPLDPLKTASYFNAIGPVALGTAVTLAIASPRSEG